MELADAVLDHLDVEGVLSANKRGAAVVGCCVILALQFTRPAVRLAVKRSLSPRGITDPN